MDKPNHKDLYASLSRIDTGNYFIEDFQADLWAASDKDTGLSPSTPFSPRAASDSCAGISPSTPFSQVPYKFPVGSSISDGYDTGEDFSVSPQRTPQAKVNIKNVVGGLVTILNGMNKEEEGGKPPENPTADSLFLQSEKNGNTFLHPLAHVPSAQAMLGIKSINHKTYREVLEADPPEWLPDSYATVCMQCALPFKVLRRGRHHCRFCGGIFCGECTKGICLLPHKFQERDPQRVCDACYDRLEPLQSILIKSISNAVQTAKYDVMDWTSARGWFNFPVGLSMEHEIYKAANTLRSYIKVAKSNPEGSIPSAVLKGAKGLAILTVAKVGAVVTYKIGTGLVLSKRSNGSWSAPSSIVSAGLGWGAQIGGELTDFVIVLHGFKAVKTFCSHVHFSLGAAVSAAAGPVGRVLEADLRAGEKGSGVCYTYSCSKGAFVGVSFEGNFFATRTAANTRFYGDPYLTATEILLGLVERPKAAAPLYSALDDLYLTLEQ